MFLNVSLVQLSQATIFIFNLYRHFPSYILRGNFLTFDKNCCFENVVQTKYKNNEFWGKYTLILQRSSNTGHLNNMAPKIFFCCKFWMQTLNILVIFSYESLFLCVITSKNIRYLLINLLDLFKKINETASVYLEPF